MSEDLLVADGRRAQPGPVVGHHHPRYLYPVLGLVALGGYPLFLALPFLLWLLA